MAAPPREVYLADGFDGNKLKVPQLRSVLLEHGIYFPSAAKKADLVALFASQVQPKAAQILAADAKVRPSGHGIIAVSDNGDEAPVVPPTPSAGVKRPRARPKKSVAEVVDTEVQAEAEPEPPTPAPAAKRARSRRSTVEPEPLTATPKKPRRSIKKKLEEAAAEPEPGPSAPEAPVQPKVEAPRSTRKPRASERPPAHDASLMPVVEIPSPVQRPVIEEPRKPRISMDNDDGGFSDFNPFQAGSSQAAQAERRRRKSSLGLEVKRRAPRPSEWTATSAPTEAGAPSLGTPPSLRTPSVLRRVGPSTEDLRSPPNEIRDQYRNEVQAAEEKNRVVEEKIQDVQVRPKKSKAIMRPKPKTVKPAASITTLAFSLLIVLLCSYYKSLSAANGFCDPGSNTNDVIQGREIPIKNAQACVTRQAEWKLDHRDADVPFECDRAALPLVPLPRPTHCVPCPPHATCMNGEVINCAPEYILTPHILAPLSPVLDGWPFLPPRVFPPHCRPDTARMRQVGQLARQIESELARTKGNVICAGEKTYSRTEPTLRESFADRRLPTISREQFDEFFDSALQDLVEHGDVTETIDLDGVSWYAAARTELTVACHAKLEVVHLLNRWKSELGMTAAVIAAIFLFKTQIENAREERKRAHELAHVVLKRLQDQEQLHYTDPVTTPQPYLPPAQLRDIVLPASESAATRHRLWARVEKEIEKNSNVAISEREVRGDMWKTWEWTGVGQRSVEYL